jgi:hypothetical protein
MEVEMNGLAMLGIWAAVAAAIAVVAGWGPLQIWLELHDKLAAWVQAVFSVIAIAAAGMFAYLPIEAARRDAMRARQDSKKALVEVVAHLARMLTGELAAKVHEFDHRAGPLVIDVHPAAEPFAEVALAAKAIPLHDLREVAEVQLVFALRKLSQRAVDVHETAVKERHHFRDASVVYDPFATVAGDVRALVATCEKRMAELAVVRPPLNQ